VWDIIDPDVKRAIERFASRAELVHWSGSAERDIANTRGVTKAGVLEGILDHLSCGYAFHGDFMANGDLAYIFQCFVGPGRLYVKVKFIASSAEEVMYVFSAHKDR
jgi:hypothetical protein